MYYILVIRSVKYLKISFNYPYIIFIVLASIEVILFPKKK